MWLSCWLTHTFFPDGSIAFNSMRRNKAKGSSNSGDGRRQHRFRTWLNKPHDSVTTESDTAITTKGSSSVTPVIAKVDEKKPVPKQENTSDSTTTASSVRTTPVATNVSTTESIAKEENTTDSKLMEVTKTPTVPPSPLQRAIGRLNTAIQRLYKINGFLDNEMKDVTNAKSDASWWEKPVNPPSLDVKELDSEIDRVSQLTDRLLSDRRELAGPQGGILPATKNFLGTACYALSPATKVILAAASQGSSLVNSPTSKTKLMNKIPVLSPYGILFNTLSKLIEVTLSVDFC
jgi:hypothetical protein